MKEICLGVEPFHQPSPVVNPGGDCFACALFAILRHLQPGAVSFEQCLEFFREKYHNSEEEFYNCTWPGFKSAVERAKEQLGIKVRIIYDFVEPRYRPAIHSHAFWTFLPLQEWGKRLESYLSEGWVAAAVIDFDGRGALLPDGTFNEHNHFITIDGFRSSEQPHPTVAGAQIIVNEAHVACSVKGAYWIDVTDLLKKYGAAALWLVRKSAGEVQD